MKIIKDRVKSKIKEKYGSVYRYAKEKNISLQYLSNVLAGRKISRPIIHQIAKDINMPELNYFYEEFIQEREKK